jgi:hypothetical protein
VFQNLSYSGYQAERNCFPAYLLPKYIVQGYENEVTKDTDPQPVFKENLDVLGVRVSMKEVLIDAIKSGKWALIEGLNDIKITGDGGFLYKRRSMIVFFLQSLMKTSQAQGLESTTPIGIAIGKV